MNTKPELPIIAFSSPGKWAAWLAKNYSKSTGVWVRMYKKDSAIKSITYAEALDEALCYGWIDGQKNRFDDQSWIQRFTPRRPRSIWSKRNREHIARLIEENRMKPAGMKQVEEAKKDGRWESAYDSPSNASIPEDFLKELAKNKKAKAFFDSLNKANRYAIAWRLQTAKKPETRQKRMLALLAMMKEGKRLH